MLVLLIVTSGCQTADNIITPEPSVANLQSNKEAVTTEKSIDKVTGESDIEKRSSAELQKNMISRWSGLLGHGGLPQSSSGEEKTTPKTEKSADKVTGKPEEKEKGSFIELEKNVVGKWLNLKETESIEFFDDGNIVIVDKRGTNPKSRGNYKFVDEGRLRVVFRGDIYAKLIPPMSFKISISENEITLTDEPDGAATTYKRIK